MSEPSQKLVDLDFIVSRIGMPAVILGIILWFHFHEFQDFVKATNWNLQRSIRNGTSDYATRRNSHYLRR